MGVLKVRNCVFRQFREGRVKVTIKIPCVDQVLGSRRGSFIGGDGGCAACHTLLLPHKPPYSNNKHDIKHTWKTVRMSRIPFMECLEVINPKAIEKIILNPDEVA